jgi:hypothetical protein
MITLWFSSIWGVKNQMDESFGNNQDRNADTTLV